MPVPISHLRGMLMPGLLENIHAADMRQWNNIFKPIADPMDEAAEYYKTITDLNDELQSRG